MAGTTTHFVYDGNQVIAEYDGSGTLLRKFAYGPGIDQPVMMEQGGQRYYYHSDALGSVIALTDSAGTITETYRYEAFGEPEAASALGNPYMFTGRRYDPETGTYYYRARNYSPDLRRFMEPDPIGYVDGMNLYAYVGNSPVNFVDPEGEFAVLIAAFAARAVIGASVDLGIQLIASGGDFESVDWKDVAISAGVSGFAPGILSAGKNVFRSGKALRTLTNQLKRSRTTNKFEKIQHRIKRHKGIIKKQIKIQAVIQSGKFILKESFDSKSEK